MRLDGKSILITGAGTGIGASAARQMVSLGASVTLAGIPRDAVEALASEINAISPGSALAVTTDVTSDAAVKGAVACAVESFGKLDVVVANAGVQRHRTDVALHTMDEQEWEKTQDVNLRGVVRTCKHALAQMLEQGRGGAVILISSITALSGATPNVSYMTAKTAMLGLNRHIAVHYAKHGIRSNAICPGALERTPDWGEHPSPDKRKHVLEKAIPLGRLGRPEDIAPWIAFLASDAAGYATGAQFVVDGGITVT